jgi:hypothetical protein
MQKGFTLEESAKLNNFAVEPTMYVDDTMGSGFTEYAEKLNGRFAMIGFVSLILTEVIAGESFVGFFARIFS